MPALARVRGVICSTSGSELLITLEKRKARFCAGGVGIWGVVARPTFGDTLSSSSR